MLPVFARQIPLQVWAIFYTRRCAEQAEELLSTFQKVAGAMGMRIERPIKIELRDDRTENYVKSIHSQLTSEVCPKKRIAFRLKILYNLLLMQK